MLTLQQHLMHTDEDQPVVEDIIVGYNDKAQLLIQLQHTDYEDSRYTCHTSLVIEREDAYKWARQWQVTLRDLPQAIGKRFKAYGNSTNARYDDVSRCFGEIIDCLVDGKCRYRIVREYGKHGFSCG